jgi:hypothetical protein
MPIPEKNGDAVAHDAEAVIVKTTIAERGCAGEVRMTISRCTASRYDLSDALPRKRFPNARENRSAKRTLGEVRTSPRIDQLAMRITRC